MGFRLPLARPQNLAPSTLLGSVLVSRSSERAELFFRLVAETQKKKGWVQCFQLVLRVCERKKKTREAAKVYRSLQVMRGVYFLLSRSAEYLDVLR